jgi:hypothetical protein
LFTLSLHARFPDNALYECSLWLKVSTGMVNAAARGQGSAYAQGGAEQHSLKAKERGVGQEARQGQVVEGKKVDHLGIEA